MLIIHTANVRLAAEVLPLGRAKTSCSFIVVKSVCVFGEKGAALLGVEGLGEQSEGLVCT